MTMSARCLFGDSGTALGTGRAAGKSVSCCYLRCQLFELGCTKQARVVHEAATHPAYGVQELIIWCRQAAHWLSTELVDHSASGVARVQRVIFWFDQHWGCQLDL